MLAARIIRVGHVRHRPLDCLLRVLEILRDLRKGFIQRPHALLQLRLGRCDLLLDVAVEVGIVAAPEIADDPMSCVALGAGQTLEDKMLRGALLAA